MKFYVNGKEQDFDAGKDRITYEGICELAEEKPEHNPSCVFTSQSGDGCLYQGEDLVLASGMRIECVRTGNA